MTAASPHTLKRFPGYKALVRHFDQMPDHVRWHFPCLAKLLADDLPIEISLAYTFLKLEQAWNRSLYGGLVRLHKAEPAFVRRILDKQHLTRAGFQTLFENIYGHAPAGKGDLDKAETVRDRVIHGKEVKSTELREAVGDALDYSKALHEQIAGIAGFTPFGDMRGFSSKVVALDKATTKWVMKGMGFAVK